jgi:hypothetical protein
MDLTVNEIKSWAPDLVIDSYPEGTKAGNIVGVVVIPHGRIKIMPKHRKPGK